MYRDDFLKEAERIVCSDRESQYGAPEDSFGLIAELWTAYLEAKRYRSTRKTWLP